MKITLVAVAAALIALVGCNAGTSGGPGADKEKDKKGRVEKVEDKLRQADDSFSMSVPTFSTKIEQGGSKEATVGISRGKNFDEDVSLKFDDLPKGVTVKPATTTIKHGDKDTKLTFKAADDAALGDFTVKLTGHPQKGGDATNEIKLTVHKK
jgi:TolA-binding protein